MNNLIHDLQFNHWQAILLSALPALLNLFIFFYVRLRFPLDKTSKTFSLFLLSLVVFQTSDTFIRMSGTLETAILWNCIFIIGVLFVTPLGMQFCLLYTGRKKYAESLTVQVLLYAPAFVFLILTFLFKDAYNFSKSSFWGWLYQENPGSIFALEGYWIGSLGILILFLLVQHAFRLPAKSDKRKQSIIISIGFAIPLSQGIFTEVILPVIGNAHDIPLTSAFMSFFSAGILIALKKYRLFSITDSLQTMTILEAMTDILIILSPDKKIQFINQEGERVLGINQFKKDVLKIEDFFPENSQGKENFNVTLFEPVLEGKKITNYSTELSTKTGKLIPVVISATSYQVTLRESQVLLLIHDISDLIQTEQQLALREEQLKDKTEELNSFFYRTTHDLKGPVTSILGLTKLARKEHDEKMLDVCIDKIELSALRLNSILLDFIKVMHVREKMLEISVIDFPKMTKNIIQSLLHSTDDDIVDFKVYVDPNVHFHSDESLLDSIIYNLVANAVNYRNSNADVKPFVSIEILNSENGILLKVSDNGIGIQKENQSKIYNLFFREASDSKGTGLGLYILRNAVNKLNGEISLESEPNQGTTFYIHLPDLHQAPQPLKKKISKIKLIVQ